MRSLEENRPVDEDGNPVPWMNHSVIEFLEKRLKNDLELFEFGSGYSTSFYAKLVKRVTSVEYDRSWFQYITTVIPSNVELILREKDVDGEYCRAVTERAEKYDVVIVDGRDRVNCVKQSITALSERGVIVLDDTQRKEYQEALEYARSYGFRTLDLEGLKPTGKNIDRTTIIYKNGNCLGI